MKRAIRLGIILLCCFSFIGMSDVSGKDQADDDCLILEIDYGSRLPVRTQKTLRVKDRTVLEALQTVAAVETHPVGQHVFVVSIDGIEGKRGKTAWYYTVDGKPAKQLAYSNMLSNARHIKWIYKEDVCSWKVDGGPNPNKEKN